MQAAQSVRDQSMPGFPGETCETPVGSVLGPSALATAAEGALSAGRSGDNYASSLVLAIEAGIWVNFQVRFHLQHGIASASGNAVYSMGEHYIATTGTVPGCEVVERLRFGVYGATY